MGLIPATSVPDLKEPASQPNKMTPYPCFEISNFNTITMAQIITENGIRVPSDESAPKVLNVAFVVISKEELTQSDWANHQYYIDNFTKHENDDYFEFYNFWEATGGKASLNVYPRDTGDELLLSHYLTEDPVLLCISISGNRIVNECMGVQYICTAIYDDGRQEDVTSSCSWSENSSCASISIDGYLQTQDVTSDEKCRLTATYSGKSDNFDVSIKNLLDKSGAYVSENGKCNGYAPCFSSIVDAYKDIEDGQQIKIMAGFYLENLLLNDSVDVTFSGGWNDDYSSNNSGQSIIGGSLTISAGTVTVDGTIVLDGTDSLAKLKGSKFGCWTPWKTIKNIHILPVK